MNKIKITIAGHFYESRYVALHLNMHLHRTQGTCVRTDKLYHSAIICFEHYEYEFDYTECVQRQLA